MPETTRKSAKSLKAPSRGVSTALVEAHIAKPTGRPSKYSPEIARIICEQLSEGIPLRQICRENEGFPAWRTVYDWMGRDDALGVGGVGLSAAIAHARDIGYDAIAEDCLRIADTPHQGESVTDDGERQSVKREDMLGHRKLQVETRLKLLAKFHPTKYGDKLGLHGVDGVAAIKTENINATQFLDIIKNLELSKRAAD